MFYFNFEQIEKKKKKKICESIKWKIKIKSKKNIRK